ncbi:hypothetical protein SAMN05444355_10955 [Flavobacterium frigoris]|uniref:Uncharacterized protein n=1 Tax=Flavobacterium frigoris TaxID=229204 RepID=A0A1H9MWU2_FLAFI|nr:hypothetical protein SAMN05444355_10955 [Flavobacterium frigoris]
MKKVHLDVSYMSGMKNNYFTIQLSDGGDL